MSQTQAFLARIVSSYGPSVGIDNCDFCLFKQVIADAEENVWLVAPRVGGRVSFYIGNYEADVEGDKVVAKPAISAPPRPPFEWMVERQLGIPGYFCIIDPATNRAWTLTGADPKTQVELTPYDKENVEPSQVFKYESA